ncbi:HAD-IIB family hydrolase [Bacteriovoracaceae bacterium]|nr:HAD-IIB family hydrolase [Bacteriovoracaceae bacterium]
MFSDFDGTLTEKGMVSSKLINLINFIHLNNRELVITTGRGHAWGLFLLTHFPLDKIIVENGGVIIKKIFRKDGRKVFKTYELQTKKQKDLQKVNLKKLLKKFPGIKLSDDSVFRSCDLSIDLIENKKYIHSDFFAELKKLKFSYSTSNVHVNFQIGTFDKFKAIKKFCEQEKVNLNSIIFFGDSLNDEPVFRHLKQTVGVSNIHERINEFKHLPQVILNGAKNKEIKGVANYLKNIL